MKAAVPLARLLIEQHRSDEAIALVRPIFHAHSEKTGSVDLIAAANLLSAGTLSAPA